MTLLKKKKISVCFLKPNRMHPLNVVAVVAEKDVDSFGEEKIAVCFLKPNQMHPLNAVAVVAEKTMTLEGKKIVVCFLKPNRLVSIVPEIKFLR